jgi:hypothetical protein
MGSFTRNEGEGLYHPHHLHKKYPLNSEMRRKITDDHTSETQEFKNCLCINEEYYLLEYKTVRFVKVIWHLQGTSPTSSGSKVCLPPFKYGLKDALCVCKKLLNKF